MSEDRLEKALKALRTETVDAERLATAQARVWQKLESRDTSLCGEFQLQFRDYLEGRLTESRRLLMEDHLGRCPNCRAQLAALKGERRPEVSPIRRVSRRPRWATWAAAAAVLLAALYMGRGAIDSVFAPSGPPATVASVKGALHLVPEGILGSGSIIREGEIIRTGPASHAVLRLADGSLVDVNERTELSLQKAWSGKTVRLHRGDILIQAAKQRRGYLRVRTRDSLASVKGTIFAVSSGLSGSVVSVIEGSVEVAQTGSEVLLSPGEQSATNPALVSSVQQAVSWSPDAETYIEMLASLADLEQKIATLPAQPMRTQSFLLGCLPPNTVVFGAVPNLTDTISQAMSLVEQQSFENPAFGQWWNSASGEELKQLIHRIESVSPLLGDELVYGYSLGEPGKAEKVPMVLAEVQPGKQEELASALNSLAEAGVKPLSYRMVDSLMVLSESPEYLDWLTANLGKGASSPFADEIATRYRRGAGWMLGMDMNSIISLPEDAVPDFIGMQQVKYLFLERRNPQGAEENEMTLSFNGPRMGLASFLADSGSGGAAEYITGDALAAIYAATREPKQLFDELTERLSAFSPEFRENLASAEFEIGMDFSNDLIRAFGTESAFALEGISTSGPVWTLALLVNDPDTVDLAMQRLADCINAKLAAAGKGDRISIMQESIDGRTWTTMSILQSPITIAWTYDRGYMIAASDRGTAIRALAARDGGSSLVWSPSFQQQLSVTSGLHPSGFAWLNTRGAFENFAGLVRNPTIEELISARDPILVVFDATAEQIRAISRTRLSGVIMDIMLMQGLGRMPHESQADAL